MSPASGAVKRIKKRPLFVLSGVTIIIGTLLAGFEWRMGVAVILVGIIIDQPHWRCGSCGNRVEKEGKFCPSCWSSLKGEQNEH